MKKTIKKLLSFILIIPCLFVCACSNTKTDPINLSGYYESPIETSILVGGLTKTKELTLDDISSKKPVTAKLDTYLKFTFVAKSDFIYKMYIEKIEFYVYANQDASEMTLNLAISNLADEDKLSSPETLTKDQAIIPQKGESILVSYDINKVVATATGSAIAIDILESKNNTLTDSTGNETGFKWIIHGFKIYGESRAYSK